MKTSKNLNRAMEADPISKNETNLKICLTSKKNLLLTVFIVLFLSGTNLIAQTYSGGSGTENDPYLISSNADMETLANAVYNGTNYSQGKYFLLTADLTGITTIIGNSGTTTKTFQGNFDGGGHNVGLGINGNFIYAGVIGNALGATIKNLGVNGSSGISGNSTTRYVGGICGYATNATIYNCYNTGAVTSSTTSNSTTSYSYYSGGICGYSTGSTISNCYNTGIVSSSNSSYSYSGGLCGYSTGSTISNCCNTGAVSSSTTSSTYYYSYSGGICGYSTGSTISNCYNTGAVSSSSYYYNYNSSEYSFASSGGICGYVTGTVIIYCYNRGNVLSTYNSTYIYNFLCWAGGICGQFDFTSSITNCFNANATIVNKNSSTHAGRIAGAGDGTISGCYSLATTQVNGSTVSSTDATSKSGADGDVASFQSQSWLVSNLGWDFTNTWYIPTPVNYPLLKKSPNIRISQHIITYGETATILSDNTSSVISYSVSDPSVVSITNNIITPLKTGTVSITASQTTSDEYAAQTVIFQFVINQKELTITANNATMLYGDTSPAFTCQYSGFVNGETSSVLTTLPTMSCSAGSASNVGNYPIVPSGAESPNYSFDYQDGTLTITKRNLNVTPNDVTRIYGSTNPPFTFNYSGFVNGETSSVITASPTATTTATVTSPVGNYNITCSGGSATNYNFVYGTGNLSVVKATLTAVADNKSRAYGAGNPTFTITYYGFKNSDNETSLTQAPIAICQATSISSFGDYPIVLSGGDAQNYDFTLMNGTLTVNKAAVTVTALAASSVYGENVPAFYCQYSGFVNGETSSVLTTLPTMTCSASSASNVGNYTITPSGAEAQNYSFVYQNGTLTITKRNLNVTPNDVARAYGNTNPLFTFNYSGFVNGETSSVITTSPTATTTATVTSPVGNYNITCSGGSATNYNFVYGTGNLSVTKATLTAVADNKNRAYGAGNPTFTITYYGFINSDNETSLTQAPIAICQATPISPFGDYPIVLSGGDAQNYDFTLMNGTLTVNKAAVTITALAASSVYGENVPAFSCQYSGFVNGETSSVLTTLPTMTCSAGSASNVGNYTIVPSGAEAQNYSFVYQNGTLTITKRFLSVTPDNTTREYGDYNTSFTVSYSGFVNGDNAGSISTDPIATSEATQTSDVGTYDITCSGGNAINYDFTYNTGTLTVTKAPLTIGVYNATRMQGQANPNFTLFYSGFKNNENYLVLNELPVAICAADETSSTGFYEIALSGGSDNNYDYTFINGTLEVTPLTGITDLSAQGISIYPNPAVDKFFIECESLLLIKLYDMLGKEVLSQNAKDKTEINISHLPNGIYSVRVISKEGVIRNGKVVKQ